MESQSKSWLDELQTRMNIDADTLDPELINSTPIVPDDQTSNPVWLCRQLSHPSNKAILESTVKACSKNERDWTEIYTKIAASMCKKTLPLIRGRVLVQTFPSKAYDTAGTVAHAKLYDKELRAQGIPRERFCIKILATGPGMVAARILQSEGISTLGTAVFSVEQAVAASQAYCLYISPYYNEVRSHREPSLWPNVKDPALEHPFSPRIMQMVEIYRTLQAETGQQQPLVKNAAYRSIEEVIATAELGCHSATISPLVLDKLARTPYDRNLDLILGGDEAAQLRRFETTESSRLPATRLRPHLTADPLKSGAYTPVRTDIDYLSHGGEELQRALDNDPEGKKRLEDAIKFFVNAEMTSKALIEDAMLRVATEQPSL